MSPMHFRRSRGWDVKLVLMTRCRLSRIAPGRRPDESPDDPLSSVRHGSSSQTRGRRERRGASFRVSARAGRDGPAAPSSDPPDAEACRRHLDGGSIFWVIARRVQCRQRILDITPDQRSTGRPAWRSFWIREIVLVDGRAVRPFQGWRYLDRDAAPRDILEGTDTGAQLPISAAACPDGALSVVRS